MISARLADLRSLASQFPEERACASAADHVASAIQALAPMVTAKKA